MRSSSTTPSRRSLEVEKTGLCWLAITSRTLGMLHGIVEQPHRWVELGVLVLANLVASAVRFVLLRGWVFHPNRTR